MATFLFYFLGCELAAQSHKPIISVSLIDKKMLVSKQSLMEIHRFASAFIQKCNTLSSYDKSEDLTAWVRKLIILTLMHKRKKQFNPTYDPLPKFFNSGGLMIYPLDLLKPKMKI